MIALWPLALAATATDSAHVGPAFNLEARCLVRSHAKAASAFAASIPGSEDERIAIAALRDASIACNLGDNLSVENTLLLGGAIAENIRLPEYPKVIKGTYRGKTNATMDKHGVSESILNEERSLPRAIAVSQCAIIRNPRLDDDILRSKPGSDREKRLMERLIPDLARCVDKGATVGLDRQIIRAVIARQHYNIRISMIPASALYWNMEVSP